MRTPGVVVAAMLFGASFAHAGEAKPYLGKIANRAEFDRLARTYSNGDFASLPHLLLVLDRAPGGKLYFVDSKKFAMHHDFVAAQYLSLEKGREFFKHSYIDADRRFVLATLAWQAPAKRYSVELGEADQATPALVRELMRRVKAGFFAPVAFKPNSNAQETMAKALEGVAVVTAGELYRAKEARVFGEGRALGTLRYVERLSDETLLRPGEIVMFGESPVTLTPVSGVITTSFSTPLAHATLLARGWGVPVAYLQGGREKYGGLLGRTVVFEAKEGAVSLRAATQAELVTGGTSRAVVTLAAPRADLGVTRLATLDEQRAGDVVRYGAKSANLGELSFAIRAGSVHHVTVPPGVSIPFSWYDEFVRENGFAVDVDALLSDRSLIDDAARRRDALAALRAKLQAGKVSAARVEELTGRVHEVVGDAGVFVRSSTNSEDLPNFNGAGLYTSMPNVKGDAALVEALKTVWASLWNYEAFEARERAGVDHRAVKPAVLVQEGMNADTAGVLVTTNPFDSAARHAVYVNAKRGLGIRVVEGRRIPEQLVYDVKTTAVRVLTRSDDDTMLTFDERGGVREVKVETNRQVLTDAMVKKLAAAALEVEHVFGDRAQDIEWLTVGDRLYFVQARPFVR